MLDGRTPLHVFEKGTVIGVRYRDEILEPYVRLFRGAVGPEFILMDDNARPHRALLIDEFLESEDIRRMDWSARSPDLNPIDNVWDALGRAIAIRNPPPRTIQEMKTALLNEWDQLSQEMINCLILSMKSRCKACISDGETALHLAAMRGHLDVVRCLIDASANPDIADKHGCTALHWALRRHHSAIAIMLLQYGCNIDTVDHVGEAPIHIVSREGLLSMAQTLCAFGCKVEIPNKLGQYPLHLAARSGHMELVRCLCLAGCDVELRNKDGITAEISALAQGFNEMANLLNKLRNVHLREEYISQLIPSTKPISKIKLKLFGHSGVGKSTFIDSLKCGYFVSWFRRSVGSMSPKNTRNKKSDSMSQSVIELNSSGTNNLQFETNYETYTHGIDVQQLNISGIGEISLWEFSGHEPYYMIYDNFIGNTNCLHLVFFSLSDPYDTQVQQVQFWLSFLQSRIPVHEPLGFGGKSGKAARIALVATHADSSSCHRVAATGEYVSSEATSVLRTMQLKFGKIFDLHETVFVLDAHVVGSPALKALKNYVAHHKDKVTQGLPKSTGFLEGVCSHLATTWRKSRCCFPVMSWKEFIDLVHSEVNPLAGEEHMKELIQQLQIMGEAVYLACENDDVVILDPTWLCVTILGFLLSQENLEQSRVTGIYSGDDIQLLYPEADGQKLLKVNLRRAIKENGDPECDLYQWYYGSKYSSGLLEGLVTLTDDETAYEIKVRGPATLKPECFFFLEDLISIAEQMFSDVCPGAILGRHYLSCAQLKSHSKNVYTYSPATIINALVQDGVYSTVTNQVTGANETLLNIIFFGAAEVLMFSHRSSSPEIPSLNFQNAALNKPRMPHSQTSPSLALHNQHSNSNQKLSQRRKSLPPTITSSTSNKTQSSPCQILQDFYSKLSQRRESSPAILHDQNPVVVLVSDLHASQLPLLSCQCLCAILDTPDSMGRDWCMLGVLLGMTDKLPKLDPGDNPAFSPTACIMSEWMKRPDTTLGQLLRRLLELERTDAIETLMPTLPMFRVTPVCFKHNFMDCNVNTDYDQ
ncbi:Death-associated protein kinase dapk-1 [Araneus ventricosus]|uniref:Death-associated protein kinase dapk-1 n=1 Tax=Araneus ventricosus TaxID=182803 RepID=A0A4Y2NK54_ARAVE|nr:Death-associated protein kinase dapk-1 [Araneus ventricosus]